MKRYNPKEIEPKWQQQWAQDKLYEAEDGSGRPKKYVLEYFPYPSGAAMHVGHVRNYTIGDAVVRFNRMRGYNVLHPMGWDAFGLPAENYAIKTGISPQQTIKESTTKFKQQLTQMGFGYDWSRELTSSDPDYYKWTQWFFLLLHKRGLAYRKESLQWWCPVDKTVLANEQVENGKCWRCGSVVEKKALPQWFFKITEYADRLAKDLDDLNWTDAIKSMQRNWIGKSKGAEIDFTVAAHYNYVLLHGHEGSSNTHFHPWASEHLQKSGAHVYVPDLPDTDKPDAEEQAKYVLDNIKFDENTVLLGHSYGSATAMRILEQLDKPIKKFVLVAGFAEPGFSDQERNFEKTTNWSFDFEKIKKNAGEVLILRDQSDPAVPPERADFLQDKLGGNIIDFTAERRHVCGKVEPVVLENLADNIKVFTTRPDTIYGATFMVLAPEHPIVQKITTEKQRAEVNDYVKHAQAKSDIERQNTEREKTGVFTGAYAINPANSQKIPVWVADYVLYGYGTGAIMAVPAHDERDLEFAQTMNRVHELEQPQTFVDQTTPPKDGQDFEERQAVIVVVKHPAEQKYLVLKLKTWQSDIASFVMGGIDSGETPIDAALRELAEETGYDHVASVNYTGAPYIAEFYHEHKKVNRRAHVHPVLVELSDLHQSDVSAEEQDLHELVWLDGEEALKTAHGEGAKRMFKDILGGQVKTSPLSIREVVEAQYGTVQGDEKYKQAIIAIVRNPKTNEVLVLDWGPRRDNWGGNMFVGGGIEEGEDPIETAKREIAEETGYAHVRHIKTAPSYVNNYFFSNVKNQNYHARFLPMLFELNSEEQVERQLDHNEDQFKLRWVSEKDIATTITDAAHLYGYRLLTEAVCYGGEGIMINSGKYDGMASSEAREKIVADLAKNGLGQERVNYKIRDWLISRQRYWGAPIPIVHCASCVPDDVKNKAKFEIDFVDSDNFKKLFDGSKIAITRARDDDKMPEYASINQGDIVKLTDRGSGQKVFARILSKHNYRNLKELYGDTNTLKRSFAKEFQSEQELSAQYEVNRPGYVETINKQGAWAWHIEVIRSSVPVPEDQLPVVLPEMESYEPSGDGRSPLARVVDWVSTICPRCGGVAQRETDTMDGFACSSWYFLRFADPRNNDNPFDAKRVKYWLPVDDYIGGAEHAVMHLLYARFWTKVMYDEGLIDFQEPFKTLRNQGMILAPDGQKMSKSKGNTIEPDHLIEQGYGADAIRIMELFIGPWNQMANWSVEGMGGSYRFLQRIWTLAQEYTDQRDGDGGSVEDVELKRTMHRAIHRVSKDLEEMSFNTAIAALMETVNELYKIKTKLPFAEAGDSWKWSLETLLQLLAPFAPHIAEELWSQLGGDSSIHTSDWPVQDEKYLAQDSVKIVVQVNGKVRAQLELPSDVSEQQAIDAAKSNEKVVSYLSSKEVKKTVYVPKKLISFVV